MAVLHIVNHAVALDSCLESAAPDDAVLLIENGVYVAAQPRSGSRPLFAIDSDVRARGLTERIDERVQLVSYAEFVSLAETHNPIVTWR